MTKELWTPSNISNAKYLGPIEIQDNKGEYHTFEVMATDRTVIFGGACNVGFIESGYITKEDFESIDECLAELVSELELFYNDGKEYTSRIVCNERM